MLIVRKRNRKEAGEQNRKKARKRAARLRLLGVCALIAGLLGFFVYNNMGYLSSLWESAVMSREPKKEDVKKHVKQVKPPQEHRSVNELLGMPEFFDDHDPKPLNTLIEELAAEMAAEQNTIQQAMLSLEARPDSVSPPIAAVPDTAPRPLVSMTPASVPVTPAPPLPPEPAARSEEPPKPVPVPIAPIVRPEGPPAPTADEEDMVRITQMPPPVEPMPRRTLWQTLVSLNPLKQTSKQDDGEIPPAAQAPTPADTVSTEAAPTFWQSILALNPFKQKPKPDVAETAPAPEPEIAAAKAAPLPPPKPEITEAKAVAPPPAKAEQAETKAVPPAPAKTEPAVALAAPAPKPDTAAVPKINPEAGSVLISNIRCWLADRADISINVSVELFYESKALSDEVHVKRGTLATVLGSVVRRQEYGNVAMAALSGELLDAFNDVLKSGQLVNVDIRSFNIVQ